ncbi:MAG: hypothetical protein QM762_07740 [Chryseolinea sp.]
MSKDPVVSLERIVFERQLAPTAFSSSLPRLDLVEQLEEQDAKEDLVDYLPPGRGGRSPCGSDTD